MRHRVDHRQFGRNTAHRRAMFRNMANSVISQERIVTTEAKAKEVRRVVDRLISLAKRGKPHARRLVFDRTRDKQVVAKLFDTLAGRYAKRDGGYTRVLKLSDPRRGDNAEMAVIELVDHAEIKRGKAPKAEGAEGAEAAAPAADTGADPFNRFRTLFGGTRKRKNAMRKAANAAAGAAEGAEGEKKAAPKKKAAKKMEASASEKTEKKEASASASEAKTAKKKTAKKKTAKKKTAKKKTAKKKKS